MRTGNFIPLVTAFAVLSLANGFTQSEQRFVFRKTGRFSDKLERGLSLQSVVEDKESDFAEITDTDVSKVQSPINYDWRKQWYAVTYDFNLPTTKEKKPLAYSIFDQELTFWADENGVIRCSEDRCPHRNARLSEGEVKDGKLECLYHGWKFDKTGDCVDIPQLPVDAVIPKAACVKMYSTAVKEGILWVWMDTPATADYNNIPTTRVDLDSPETKKNFFRYNFQIDLPYDHSFLVENLLDPAHIQVSHDSTEGGGKKANAQPLIMSLVGDLHAKGFAATYANSRASAKNPVSGPGKFFNIRSQSVRKDSSSDAKVAPLPTTELNFDAPGIVRYHADIKEKNLLFGAALHCMPMGQSKSRLLFTTFLKGPPILVFIARLKPTWIRNLNSCKILEQDISLITSQEDMLTKNQGIDANNEKEKIPAKEWLTMKSQDLILVQYRKWLDIVGPNMPYYMGWKNRSALPAIKTSFTERPSSLSHRQHESRYYRHVMNNKNMVKVLSNVVNMKKMSQVLIVLAFGASGLFQERKNRAISVAVAAISLLMRCLLSILESSFYNNFYRYPTNLYPKVSK